jgi:hypothetical protein
LKADGFRDLPYPDVDFRVFQGAIDAIDEGG